MTRSVSVRALPVGMACTIYVVVLDIAWKVSVCRKYGTSMYRNIELRYIERSKFSVHGAIELFGMSTY